MTRRAILHIGTEKTGSTSIQQFLARNRDWLATHGFHYAKAPGSPNHTRLFSYAVSSPALAFNLRTAEEHEALRTRLEADLATEVEANPGKVFLFSNEHCHSRLYAPEEVERLRALLARHFDRVDVLVYLRRQDELAVSLYSTLLKAGTSGRELLVRRPVPSLPVGSPEQTLYYDYEALLARWGAAFGAERLIVRRFPQDLVARSIIDDVCHVAGLPTPEHRPERANESLRPEFQEYLRLINPHLKVQQGSTRGEIVRVLSELGKGNGRLPARGAASAFFDRFRDSNEAVRAARFPDAATLFDEDFSRYPDASAAAPIGVDTVARITAEVLRQMALDLQDLRGGGKGPRPRRAGGGRMRGRKRQAGAKARAGD
jgi:hypothetical protein